MISQSLSRFTPVTVSRSKVSSRDCSGSLNPSMLISGRFAFTKSWFIDSSSSFSFFGIAKSEQPEVPGRAFDTYAAELLGGCELLGSDENIDPLNPDLVGGHGSHRGPLSWLAGPKVKSGLVPRTLHFMTVQNALVQRTLLMRANIANNVVVAVDIGQEYLATVKVYFPRHTWRNLIGRTYPDELRDRGKGHGYQKF